MAGRLIDADELLEWLEEQSRFYANTNLAYGSLRNATAWRDSMWSASAAFYAAAKHVREMLKEKEKDPLGQ